MRSCKLYGRCVIAFLAVLAFSANANTRILLLPKATQALAENLGKPRIATRIELEALLAAIGADVENGRSAHLTEVIVRSMKDNPSERRVCGAFTVLRPDGDRSEVFGFVGGFVSMRENEDFVMGLLFDPQIVTRDCEILGMHVGTGN